MTGEEHYLEAQRRLLRVDECTGPTGLTCAVCAKNITAANAHATLALAAATAWGLDPRINT